MARIVLKPSNKEVESAAGETVLSALERAGYALSNNCRAGACGECKVKVLSGEYDQGVVLDMALTESEREEGFGLMCMAKPLSDVMEIEWGAEDAMPKLFPPREGVLSVVVDKNQIAERVVELRIRPVGQVVRYWPGQNIFLSDEYQEVPPRQYSMANSPRHDGEIVLQIAREKDGVTSQWVHDKLKAGDRVKLRGPYGTFIGDPTVDTPVLCLAAGTGLAPILALTEAALRRGFRKKVMLLFSVRTEADIYAEGLMAWWRLKHRNFDFKITLTREEHAGRLRGRLTTLLPNLFSDLSKHSIFIAGSPGFVDDCEAKALELGASPKLIHTEGFYTSEQLQTPQYAGA